MLSEKPWKLESVARLFLGVLICIMAGSVSMQWLHPAGKSAGAAVSLLNVVVAVASFQGAALVLVWFFLRWHGIGPKDAFGFTNGWRRALLLGACGTVVFFPIGQTLQIAANKLMTLLNQSSGEQSAVQALHQVHGWQEQTVMIIIAAIIVPLAEEMLFRGVLYPLVKQLGYPRFAYIGVSALFAAIHFNLEIFPALFVLALLLTWLYEYTNNLLTCIVTHSLFNAINIALFYIIESKPAAHP